MFVFFKVYSFENKIINTPSYMNIFSLFTI